MNTELIAGLGAAVCLLFSSCSAEHTEPQWQELEEVQLGDFSPIGIAFGDSSMWLSDGDRNQLGQWTFGGEMVDLITDLDRPMHIAAHDGKIYVPEYGSDSIRIFAEGQEIGSVPLSDTLDAPAGIESNHEGMAIADFYNHRILFKAAGSDSWKSFGSEGHGIGEFYYPTDVQIKEGLIYVADAYNNRIQVLDFSGESQLVIGKEHGMNGATGIYVSDRQILVTDFENNRVLVFDHDGILQQELAEIAKPTDIAHAGGKLYVASYSDKKLKVYKM